MSRTIALPFVMLLACSVFCVVWAQEPAVRPVALPPSVGVTAGESEIEARLTWPVILDVHERSIADAISQIADAHGLDIQLDEKALVDQAIDSSVLVSFKTRRAVPLGDALELMLDPFELTYVIQHGVMQVTSKERADSIVIVRVYPVEDLVMSAAVRGAPYMPPAKSGWNYGPLIQMIEDTIAPDSWDTNSGVGSIKPFTGAPGGLAMVISNTRRVQYQVATLFADLRAMRQIPGVKVSTPALSKGMSTKTYELGTDSGPAIVNVIVKTIAPAEWQVHGGAGLIWSKPHEDDLKNCLRIGSNIPTAVTAPDNSATQTTNVARSNLPDLSDPSVHWTLVVCQTADIHQKIADMLAHRNAPGPRKGNVSGL